MSVKVINLNRISYLKALDIQEKLFQKVKQHNSNSYLLLVEHEPVYTVGIRSEQYNDASLQNKLKSLGADFQKTNRGGLITFFGKGILVAYPIIHLPSFPITNRSIKTYVCLLESVIIDVCADFNVKAGRLSGFPGVWCGDSKISAIGIRGSNYVTMHGIALNCNCDLDWFQHILPCGIEGKTVTSISNELKREVTIEEATPILVKNFNRIFRKVE